MKKYAFFQGCNIPVRIEQYSTAAEAVFRLFDIELVEEREFTCCGYPVRNVDEKSYIMPSVRNMAVAEKAELDIIVICNCCFASLMKAKNVLANNSQLKDEINTILAKENLHYSGKVEIKHFLTVLYSEIGVNAIEKKLTHKLKGFNIAVIQGCHILRPREITLFDDSFVPAITDSLVQCTGAKNIDWQGKLECCGAALAGINDDLSYKLLGEKIEGARKAGADVITPICAYCHLQFDTAQLNFASEHTEIMPVLLFPQILGLCLGLSKEELGISLNKTIKDKDINKVISSLGPPEEEPKAKRKKTSKQSA